jgi:DNA-binding NarL/FixJ family response regulator
MSELAFNILLVDDHQLIIDGIKSLFQDEKHLVFSFEANDGLSAKEIITANHENIHLIIADINMPGMSGIELCHFVKQHYSHIKVLILSMYQSTSVVKEALFAEADGYILKNTGKNDFAKALFRILDGGTYFSEAIIPIIYKEYHKEQEKKQAVSMLTKRETEVLILIAKELTSEEIANQLFISKKTIDHHRQSLLSKTGSKSTVGLVKFAIKNGLAV